MSISTRSGLALAASSTASSPRAVTPTTVCPIRSSCCWMSRATMRLSSTIRILAGVMFRLQRFERVSNLGSEAHGAGHGRLDAGFWTNADVKAKHASYHPAFVRGIRVLFADALRIVEARVARIESAWLTTGQRRSTHWPRDIYAFVRTASHALRRFRVVSS